MWMALFSFLLFIYVEHTTITYLKITELNSDNIFDSGVSVIVTKLQIPVVFHCPQLEVF